MNKENTKILNWVLIGTAIIGVGTFAYFQLAQRKRGKSKFRRKAVDIANKEWVAWNKGKTKETDRSVYNRLKKYWDAVGWKESRWSPSGVAWSSAFVSWVMREAKAGGDFNYSSSHSKYIRHAVKNRKLNTNNPFKAYKLDEKKAEVGDLVCYARQSGVGYDTTNSYDSHCDIIVSIDGSDAQVIGGNVSNSVTMKKVPLTPDGKIKSGGKRFTIIKTP